jgi:hypothetical protein
MRLYIAISRKIRTNRQIERYENKNKNEGKKANKSKGVIKNYIADDIKSSINPRYDKQENKYAMIEHSINCDEHHESLIASTSEAWMVDFEKTIENTLETSNQLIQFLNQCQADELKIIKCKTNIRNKLITFKNELDKIINS